MTKKEYEIKYKEITDWCVDETDRITKKLEKENKIVGLDGNKEEYKLIHEEYKKKLKKLKEELNK